MTFLMKMFTSILFFFLRLVKSHIWEVFLTLVAAVSQTEAVEEFWGAAGTRDDSASLVGPVLPVVVAKEYHRWSQSGGSLQWCWAHTPCWVRVIRTGPAGDKDLLDELLQLHLVGVELLLEGWKVGHAVDVLSLDTLSCMSKFAGGYSWVVQVAPNTFIMLGVQVSVHTLHLLDQGLDLLDLVTDELLLQCSRVRHVNPVSAPAIAVTSSSLLEDKTERSK